MLVPYGKAKGSTKGSGRGVPLGWGSKGMGMKGPPVKGDMGGAMMMAVPIHSWGKGMGMGWDAWDAWDWDPWADVYDGWDAWGCDGWGKAAPSKGSKGGKGGKGCKGAREVPYIASIDAMSPARSNEVQAYIDTWGLDGECLDTLWSLPPKFQRVIISQGIEDIEKIKSSSGIISARISSILRMKAGDWICPNCFDNQFAINKTCRKCGHENPYVIPEACKIVEPATPEEVDAFIAEHAIKDDGAAKLMSIAPQLQTIVMSQPLEGVTDRTAVLVSRIKLAHEMGPGDWICPACLDIQFAKNGLCRKCKTAKPIEARQESAKQLQQMKHLAAVGKGKPVFT